MRIVSIPEVKAAKATGEDPDTFFPIVHGFTEHYNGVTTAQAMKYHGLAAELPVKILVWGSAKDGHALVQFADGEPPIHVQRKVVRWVERKRGRSAKRTTPKDDAAKITGQDDRTVCHCGLELARNGTCPCSE